MPFWCVTKDDGKIGAHGPYDTIDAAEGFSDGVEWVNDGVTEVVGVFQADDEAKAIDQGIEKEWTPLTATDTTDDCAYCGRPTDPGDTVLTNGYPWHAVVCNKECARGAMSEHAH